MWLMPSEPAPADRGRDEDPARPDRDPMTAADRQAWLDRLCEQDDDPFDDPQEYWDPESCAPPPGEDELTATELAGIGEAAADDAGSDDGLGDSFGGVADHELIGLVCAWDRVEAHAAARKLIAIAEVFRRNPGDGFEPEPGQMPAVVHEFTRDQLALALGQSRAAADWLLTTAWHLGTRLGGTLDALTNGTLSRGKAELIVRLTQHLDAEEAAAAEAKVLDRAGRLTPGGLRSAVARAVMEVASEKARERRETAAKFARVERWAEDSGNAALMGRELPPDEVLAADQRIGWWAGELKAARLEGGMDELRARAFLDLLLGKDSRPRRETTAGGGGDGAGHDSSSSPGG